MSALTAEAALGDKIIDSTSTLLIARVPVLDGRVLHLGILLYYDLHNGGVQLILVTTWCGTTLQITYVCALVGFEQRALKLTRALGIDAEVGRELHRATHTLGYVAERAIREDGGVECGVEVIGMGNNRTQIFLNQIGILADSLRDRAEDNTLLGQCLTECGLDRHRIHNGIDSNASQRHLLLQRNTQLIERTL